MAHMTGNVGALVQQPCLTGQDTEARRSGYPLAAHRSLALVPGQVLVLTRGPQKCPLARAQLVFIHEAWRQHAWADLLAASWFFVPFYRNHYGLPIPPPPSV